MDPSTDLDDPTEPFPEDGLREGAPAATEMATRWRALMRIVCGRAPYSPRAKIGDLARWHGVSLRAIHSLEKRGIVTSERGPASMRFFSPDAQQRVEIAFALRQFEFSAEDIRRFLEMFDADRTAARRSLAELLETRLSDMARQQAFLLAARSELCEAAGLQVDDPARFAAE